jgi:hypothetical protein
MSRSNAQLSRWPSSRDGDEQGEQLVAQLVVAQPVAVLVARQQEHREDVLALGEVRGPAPAADLGKQRLVDRAHHAPERPERPDPVGRHRDERGHHRGVHERLEQAQQHGAQVPDLVGGGDPEHRAQDHVERDGLHALGEHERLPGRPGRDLALGGLDDDLAVALHALAVERRQQELALAKVVGAVEQEDRVAAEDRQQDAVALARAQHGRIAGEDLLDEVGMREDDEALAALQRDREHVAVAAVHAAQQRLGRVVHASVWTSTGHGRAGRAAG